MFFFSKVTDTDFAFVIYISPQSPTFNIVIGVRLRGRSCCNKYSYRSYRSIV